MGKPKVKKVIPYTERERNMKVMNFVLQISDLKMERVITPEIKDGFNDFIKLGKDYIDCIDLPKHSRKMIINLVNDKNKQTFINFKFHDFTIDDNEKCDNEKCEDNNIVSL